MSRACSPDVPLWDAIIWSVVLGLANVYVMSKLVLERTTFRLSERERSLFEVFNTLNPGEFRHLLKITEWHRSEAGTPSIITTEGEFCDKLYFILTGNINIKKGKRTFDIQPQKFIGEVSYYLSEPASATVRVENADYVSWPHDALDSLKRKNPGIRVAIQQILNTDMARKIGVS